MNGKVYRSDLWKDVKQNVEGLEDYSEIKLANGLRRFCKIEGLKIESDQDREGRYYRFHKEGAE